MTSKSYEVICAESFQICWGELLLQEAKLKQSQHHRGEQRLTFSSGEMLSVLLVALLCYNFRSKLRHKLTIWTSSLVLLPFCAPQASSVPETRQPKETTDSWIKFKRSVGSVRTLVTLEEIRVASRSLDLESELPVSACWLCPTTQKVRMCRLTVKTRFCGSAAVERLINAHKWEHFRLFKMFVKIFVLT